MTRIVHTHCRICVAVCGIRVTVDEGTNRVLQIAPDKQNPYTWRDFCAKARTGRELVEHPRRLLHPMKRVGDRYVQVPYDEATAEIAGDLRAIIDRHGPDAVASYAGNPSLFSMSSSMFFGGLLDAIGTANRFWIGSVDQNSLHVVSEAMYGSPLLYLVPDVDDCRCFLMIGANPAESAMNWAESVPDGWRRVLRAQEQGADLIVVDPRRTPTAARADTHIAVRPGEDWAFLLGVLAVILGEDLHRPSSTVPVVGMTELRQLVGEARLQDLAARCDVPAEQIRDVARRFATASTAMCLTRTGVSQTAHGALGEWLGHVLNAVTDRLDRPGGRRYQPGYVDFLKLFPLFAPPSRHHTRLRNLPPIAGHHALAELPDEITTPGPGQIRALLVNGGNPVVSGPQGAALDAALAQLELLVAVDLLQRESHRHAHWLIPGFHWLERDELHVLLHSAQDLPYVQYGARAVDPPEGLKEEWEFFTDLALALDRPLFGKRGANTLVRSSRALARLVGRANLAFRPRWIERALVVYGRKVRWRDILAHPHGWIYGEKQYGHFARMLRTPDRAVHVSPPAFLAQTRILLGSGDATDPGSLRLVNHRRHDSMNSWLNDLPSLHRYRRDNDL
jgi:formate dehydrogenase